MADDNNNNNNKSACKKAALRRRGAALKRPSEHTPPISSLSTLVLPRKSSCPFGEYSFKIWNLGMYKHYGLCFKKETKVKFNSDSFHVAAGIQ